VPQHSIGQPGWELASHVAMATTAFAFLTIGMVLAIAQGTRSPAAQPPATGLLKILTPLESLESGWFQSIVAGVTVLTLALVSGAFFVQDLFAQHLIHKVVLAIIAWVVFGVLLLGRFKFGWRGRQALRWTFAGYRCSVFLFRQQLILEHPAALGLSRHGRLIRRYARSRFLLVSADSPLRFFSGTETR
jgi:ABC-type uncharacterized transport system permease subunit